MKRPRAAPGPIEDYKPPSEVSTAVLAILGSFLCYFCMYAFRRPFTVAEFDGPAIGEVSFKVLLVTSQILGYTLAKFIGIRVVSELSPRRRARGILVLIALAELSLVIFGATPRPWSALAMFGNGLALGMVFGLVLGFLEGRRCTELLVAMLCTSFILADGVTKAVGATLLENGVLERWMPAATGACFLAPLLLSVWLLTRVPSPTAADIGARAARPEMTRAERWAFIERHWATLLPIVCMYLAVTVVRSVRADFAPEIWRGLGVDAAPSAFATTELWVAIAVLIAHGSLALVRDNLQAYRLSLWLCGVGVAVLALTLAAPTTGQGAGLRFMVLTGIGLYLPYVAVHTTIFERLIPLTGERGNIGFLMYLADAFAYLGYVVLITSSRWVEIRVEPLFLLRLSGWWAIAVSVLALALAARTGFRKARRVGASDGTDSAAKLLRGTEPSV